MADGSVPTSRSGNQAGSDSGAGTRWHGSDEPPAPWERGTVNGGSGTWSSTQDGNGDDDHTAPRVYPPAPAQRSANSRRRLRTAVVAGLAVVVVALAATAALLSGVTTNTDPAGNVQSQQASDFQAQPGPVQQATGVSPDWTATAEAVAPSVVSITVDAYQGTAEGSGVILDTAGHVVTNNHVIASASTGRGEIAVTLNDKRTFTATVVGTDPSTDLAVLEMIQAPGDLRPISLGNSDELQVGVPVMAVGNPLGLSGTVTIGIVSALDRPLITSGRPDGMDAAITDDIVTNAIQTSAAINPGNSGGALVNPSGQLIGINSSIAQTSQSGGNIGIGFAIPVNQTRNIAGQLLQNGEVQHAFLGVSTRTGNVPYGSAQRAAAVVAGVSDGSPAAEAGMRSGDAIVAIDGDLIDGSASLVAQVRDRGVGQQVTITVIRGGERSDSQLTLAARPQDR